MMSSTSKHEPSTPEQPTLDQAEEAELVEATEPHILTFDEIDRIDDLAIRTIDIPGWRGAVRIRPLLLHEVTRINELSWRGKKQDVLKANSLYLSRALVEPQLTFSQALKFVQTKSAASIAKLVNAILDDSAPTEEAVERAEAEFRR